MRIESRDVKNPTLTLEPLINVGENHLVYVGDNRVEERTIKVMGKNEAVPTFEDNELRVNDMLTIMQRNNVDVARLYFARVNNMSYCCCIGLKGEIYVQ